MIGWLLYVLAGACLSFAVGIVEGSVGGLVFAGFYLLTGLAGYILFGD